MNKTTINDIDVSECNIRFYHFGKNICELGNRKLGELHYLCSENPNCYFKQLKQLQKENEELKEKINIYENSIIANHDRAVGKRLMEVLQALEEIRSYCDEQNLKADYTACYITNRIDEVLKNET